MAVHRCLMLETASQEAFDAHEACGAHRMGLICTRFQVSRALRCFMQGFGSFGWVLTCSVLLGLCSPAAGHKHSLVGSIPFDHCPTGCPSSPMGTQPWPRNGTMEGDYGNFDLIVEGLGPWPRIGTTEGDYGHFDLIVDGLRTGRCGTAPRLQLITPWWL